MKILVPAEDHLFAEVILHFLKAQSWPDGTDFKILHVITPLQDAFEWPSHCLNERAQNFVENTVQRFASALPKCVVDGQVAHGVPEEVIRKIAEEWPATIIAMGSHSRSGFAKKFIGSVSARVAKMAHCPVIILRPSMVGEGAEPKPIWLEDMTAAHKRYFEQHANEHPFPLDGSDWTRLVAMRLDNDESHEDDTVKDGDFLEKVHSLSSPLGHERAQIHDSHVHWFTIRGGKKRELSKEEEDAGTHALRVLSQVSKNKTLKDWEKDWLKKRVKAWTEAKKPATNVPDITQSTGTAEHSDG